MYSMERALHQLTSISDTFAQIAQKYLLGIFLSASSQYLLL